MATLTELARFHTALDGRGVNHLQRLVVGWGLLADFCFADLLLFAPTVDSPDGERFLVVSQVRPSTSQTVYRADWIGTIVDEEERPLVARAFRLGEIIEGEATVAALKERGLQSPYLRPFVTARLDPFRFKKDVTATPEELIAKMRAAAAKFDVAKVRADQVTAAGGQGGEGE